MPKLIKQYVRYIDALNHTVGRIVMYLIFMMMAILLYSALSRTLFNAPLSWAIEMAQFTMAAYYLLGGGYTLQNDAHVRMDLLYERWPVKKRAFVDSFTAFALVFYLGILLYGGYSSTEYALEYGQKNYSAWAPPMAPIKIIMTLGILMMLLQAIAIFFRDLATVMGKSIR
ncbi:TRAP-type C4-dicarboxylate transport system, small permease component [hydrothermal vent metagenome]|uniref:TRAP-type C4-dicarboxylate transport system, small permease component n=1 Tax=hydrothermal vent metagenome TaxID=652676 RepID=A0A3B1A5F4_9ZZZZ